MPRDKKTIAAVAAVYEYLQVEQEAMATQAAAPAERAHLPPTPIRLWGISGRQSQMQLRTMMQLKALHGRNAG